jgi:hypothetical protein
MHLMMEDVFGLLHDRTMCAGETVTVDMGRDGKQHRMHLPQADDQWSLHFDEQKND